MTLQIDTLTVQAELRNGASPSTVAEKMNIPLSEVRKILRSMRLAGEDLPSFKRGRRPSVDEREVIYQVDTLRSTQEMAAETLNCSQATISRIMKKYRSAAKKSQNSI